MKLRPRKGKFSLEPSLESPKDAEADDRAPWDEGVADKAEADDRAPWDEGKIDEEARPAPIEPVTFDDLDINSPFAEPFKDKFGFYPILMIKKYCKLPLRYDFRGKPKFKMQPLEAGQTLLVIGQEAGKRVAVNILCKDTHSKGVFVLEPKMVEKFTNVLSPGHPFYSKPKEKKSDLKEGVDIKKTTKSSTSKKPKEENPDRFKDGGRVNRKIKEMINKRKKEAMFSI